MSIRRLLAAWLPAIAWAGLIFAFSAQPDLRFLPDEGADLVVRKIGHMAAFGVLAVLAWRALERTMPLPPAPTPVLALGLTVLYAITDELHQGWVRGRHSSPVDVAIDAAGAVIALVIVVLIVRRRGA